MIETKYMEFMRIRSELIKAGKELSEATNLAYLSAYCPTEKIDLLSPANS